MDEAGDIAGISIPFTAGVAAGVALSGAAAPLSAVSLLASSLLLVRASSGRMGRAGMALVYSCLGLFCASSRVLMPGGGGGGFLTTLALKAVERLRAAIDALPLAHRSSNALICALLTGDRSGLDSPLTQTFRAAGASHILALSGLHLGVIYLIVSRCLSILGRSRPALWARSATTVLAAGFYTLMTGAGPSIVRAFLFILISEGCRLSPGRSRSPARTLLCVLMIQLVLDPEVITSLGFQLSYLAMAGITFVFPWMDGWYPEGKGPVRKVWQSAALTLSCQVFTAPLVWIRFHSFPKYFLITNLVALPLTSGIMGACVCTLALHALGICPEMLLQACDTLVQSLVFCLEVIASL